MAHRDSYYKPALSRADARSMAQDDWDALVRRHVVETGMPFERALVELLADVYVASNESTMRVYKQKMGSQS